MARLESDPVEAVVFEDLNRVLPSPLDDAQLHAVAAYLRVDELILSVAHLRFVASDDCLFAQLRLPALVKAGLRKLLAATPATPPPPAAATTTTTTSDSDDPVRDFSALFEHVWPVVLQFIKESNDPALPPVAHATAMSIAAELDLPVPDGDGPSDYKALAQLSAQVLHNSVRTNHPRFFDKLYSGADSVGVMAELLTALINCNVHTWDASPVLTLIERECVHAMSTLAGYDPATSDGVFCPGGSYSNMIALFTALQRARRLAKLTDRPRRRYVCVLGEQSHYSVKTAITLLGLADQSEPACPPSPSPPCTADQLRMWNNGIAAVQCDAAGRIVPSALAATLSALRAAGYEPFAVASTAGTTVLGAYDQFDALQDVIERAAGDLGVPWHHIDGCWGASVLMSQRHGERMRGCSRADSLAWNPHKMMHVPLQCSVLLVRRAGLLEANLTDLASSAAYLFHESDEITHPLQCDIGLKTLQCGRRADALKLWLMWKHYGRAGFARFIDYQFSLVLYFHEQVLRRPYFVPVSTSPPECLNVCFWYVPPPARASLAAADKQLPDRLPDGLFDAIADSTKHIQKSLRARGAALTDISPLPGLPHFLRFVLNNSKTTTADIDRLLDEIQDLF